NRRRDDVGQHAHGASHIAPIMAQPSKAMATGPETSHSTRMRTDRSGRIPLRTGSILSHDRFSTGRPAHSILEVDREEPAAKPPSPYSTTSPATATISSVPKGLATEAANPLF